MKYLDLTLETPQHNLALDQALLESCEEGTGHEVLRIWEPRDHFVVLGYSNSIRSDVRLPSCKNLGVPVLRRLTGGGTILQGPGCLNYALILKIDDSGPTGNITVTNHHIMTRHQAALKSVIGTPVEIQGRSDLAIGGLKFSGNAQYRKRRTLLFHGTFLIRLDISLVEKLLPLPSKAPPYRRGRAHMKFLTNLDMDSSRIKECLKNAWNATEAFHGVPCDRTNRLVKERYSTEVWNLKF